MKLLDWNIDFEFGSKELDALRKLLVEFINDYYERILNGTYEDHMTEFVETALLSAKKIFSMEEKAMKERDYIRLPYHANSHDSIILHLTNFLESFRHGAQEDPKSELKQLCTFWMTNHIVREDSQFHNFCFDKDVFANRKLHGSRCEIFTLNNHLLGEGKIRKNDMQKLYIRNQAKGIIPAENQEIIKAVVYGRKGAVVILMGRVFSNTEKFLMLFKARVLYLEESRDSVRVAAFMDARVHHKGALRTVNILNMSGSGLFFEEREILNLTGKIMLKMVLDDENFTVPCQVVRSCRQGTHAMRYGCRFMFTSHWHEEYIAKFLVTRLAIKRSAIK